VNVRTLQNELIIFGLGAVQGSIAAALMCKYLSITGIVEFIIIVLSGFPGIFIGIIEVALCEYFVARIRGRK
jgi:hypothetical protein